MKNYIILIILSALLILAVPAAAVFGFAANGGEGKITVPEKVSVYLEEEGKIVTLDYSDYITGCVFGTLSPKSERETLKAAACACSTLALYQLKNPSGSDTCGADFSDNPDISQPYMTPEAAEELYGESYQRYLEKVRDAVATGITCAITYNGAPIFPAMCSISTGSTDSSADLLDAPLPYLKSVSTACDKESADYLGTYSLSPEIVRKALKPYAPDALLNVDYTTWFSEPVYLESGTLDYIKYGGSRITGKQLREALGLRSSAITVEFAEDLFTFTTEGCGNNLGMSLYCANAFALQGQKMTDILCYFYDGTQITNI